MIACETGEAKRFWRFCHANEKMVGNPRARMGSEPAQPKSKNAGCRLCWELRLKVEVLDWRSEKVSQSGGERQRAKSRDSEKLSQDSHLPSTISIDLEQRKNQRSDWEPQYSCPPRKFLDE